MNKPTDHAVAESAPEDRAPPADESTGLPGLSSWSTVYWIVFGIFVLWIGLLTWLTQHFTA